MIIVARLLLVAVALVPAASLIAQDLSGYEPVLFPVVSSPNGVVGVGGSQFYTINQLLPLGRDVSIYPKYVREDSGGQLSWVPAFGVIPVGVVESPFCCAPSRVGRTLFVERGAATVLSAMVSSRAEGTASLSLTSLPVVREAAFETTRAIITSVFSSYSLTQSPGSVCRTPVPQFRHRLRIYDPDATGRGVVRVTTHLEGFYPPGNPSQDITVALDQREGSDQSYPSFAEVPIDEMCVPFSCNTPCSGGSQRIEIESLTPGLRFWAFVSGTDNVNQSVVVNWPQ